MQGSPGVSDSVQAVLNLEQPNQGPASAVGGQPGGQVVWALEVEQGNSCGEGCAYGQGFQLLQRQRLDLGGGGTSKWAAAAIEEAEEAPVRGLVGVGPWWRQAAQVVNA